jgi:[acyl-carrier-protein] S-malonyltransferase
MSRRRALVVCPGRGSYDRSCLGQLQARRPAAAAVLDTCDDARAANGRPTVRALDAEARFSPALHLAGEHASLLTFACALADLADLDADRYDVVGVVGNSMGFYTALAASGALPLTEAIRLVETMGGYQEGNVIGGQLLYPLAGSDWKIDVALRAAVDAALASSGGTAFWSIDLGGTAVLGGTEEGLAHLIATLPPVERGGRTFPFRLPLHSAFHTPLLADTMARAQADLVDLPFQPPRVPLIDGHGSIHRPRWADPAALWAYTLGPQVVEPFDLQLAVTVALHHIAPDVVIALGPGNGLGGPIAQMLVADGYSGIRDRAAFDARQSGDSPVLLAFGVPEQRARLVAP